MLRKIAIVDQALANFATWMLSAKRLFERLKALYLLFVCALLFSCSTVKRNGYYQTRTYTFGKHIVKQSKGNSRGHERTYDGMQYPQEPLTLHSKSPNFDFPELTKPQKYKPKLVTTFHADQSKDSNWLRQTTQDSCDVIILRDSTRIICTITNWNQVSGYSYVPCGDGDSVQSIPYLQIASVHFANGTVIIVNEPTKRKLADLTDAEKKELSSKPRKTHWATIVSVIMVGMVYGAPVGVIFGLIGLERTKRNPWKYKGHTWAKLSVIVGSLISMLMMWGFAMYGAIPTAVFILLELIFLATLIWGIASDVDA